MRYLNVPLFIVIALLLQGCPMWIATTIHNNTNLDLFVVLKNEQLKWPSGTSLRLDKNVERKMEWVQDQDKGYTIPMLNIKWDKAILTYKLYKGVPVDYMGYSMGNSLSNKTQEYRFQLQTDRKLYAVKPGDSFPSKTLYPQPLGFPIVPSK